MINVKSQSPYFKGPGGVESTLTIDKPAGLAVGDMMFLYTTLYNSGGGFPTYDASAESQGWEKILRNRWGSNARDTTMYMKIADEDDVAAANFVFTQSGGTYEPSCSGFIFVVEEHGGAESLQIWAGSPLVPQNDVNLVIPMGWAFDDDSDIATFSGYSVTGGASPAMTEIIDDNYARGSRIWSFGIAWGVYESGDNITAYNASGTAVDQNASYLLVIAQGEYPTVETDEATSITPTTAQISGEVVDATSLSESGFVYGTTSQTPEHEAPGASGYDSSIGAEVVEIGEYSRKIVGLSEFTTYYYRAYARAGIGYAYGAEQSFTTNRSVKPIILAVEDQAALLNEEREITIIGNNFYGSTVEIDGEECTNITVVDVNTITCTVPASAIAKTAVLTVINDDAQQGSTEFYYVAEVPPTPQTGSVSASFSVKGVSYLT